MNKTTATTLEELKSKIRTEIHLAQIKEHELENSIETAIKNLTSVNTVRSIALQEIIRAAYADAKHDHIEFIIGKTEYLTALKKLAMWCGQIQLGWV